MQVLKKDLIRGLTSFINEDMLPNMTDRALQMGLYAISQVFFHNPEAANKWIDTPVMQMLLCAEGDYYNLDALQSGLTSAMQRYGNLTLSIPSIPLILKHDVTISLGISDLDSLIRHIEMASNS